MENGEIVLLDEKNQIIDAFKAVGVVVTLVISDETSYVVSVEVKVRPGSKKEKIFLDDSEILTIKVSAPPEDGAANKQLKKLLGKKLGISLKNVELISGDKSKNKKLYLSFVKKVGKGIDYYISRIADLFSE